MNRRRCARRCYRWPSGDLPLLRVDPRVEPVGDADTRGGRGHATQPAIIQQGHAGTRARAARLFEGVAREAGVRLLAVIVGRERQAARGGEVRGNLSKVGSSGACERRV